MQTGITFLKKAGEAIAGDFIVKAADLYPHMMGAALVHQGKIAVAMGAGKATREKIDQVSTKYFDRDIVFYMGNTDGNVGTENLQPYTLIKQGDKTELVAFLVGGFESHAQMESAHPNAFFAAHKTLVPKVNKLYDRLGKKMDVFMDDKNGIQPEDLDGLIAEDTVITFVSSNGRTLCFGDLETLNDYTWGWSTDSCGYVEEAAPVRTEPATPQPTDDLGMFDTTEVKGSDAPRSTGPRITGDRSMASAVVDLNVGPKTSTALPVKRGAPPATIQGKQSLKAWYNKNAGFCPPNFKDRPEVNLKVDATSVATGAPMPTMAEAHKTIESFKKDTAVHDKAVAANALPVERPKIPIISAANREKIGLLLKQVDINSQEVVDVDYIAKMESKNPSFCEQMGYNMEDTFRWTIEMMTDLAKHYPEDFAILAMNWRNLGAKTWQFNKKAVTEQVKHPEGGSRIEPAAAAETVVNHQPKFQTRRRAS